MPACDLSMALIEGVGDEVTVLFSAVFLLFVLVLAWISTHTSERLLLPWVPPLTSPVDLPSSNEESPDVGDHVDLASRSPDPSHAEDPVCNNDGPPNIHSIHHVTPCPVIPDQTQGNPGAFTDAEQRNAENDTRITSESYGEPSLNAPPAQNNGEVSLNTPPTPSNKDPSPDSHLLSNNHATDPSEIDGLASLNADPTLRDGDPPPTADPTLSNSPPYVEPSLRHRAPRERAGQDPDNGTIVLRLKFLNDTERLLTVRPADTLQHVKRLYFQGQESRVRFIYQGQLLRDDSLTVSALQLRDGCVIHCHISQHASGQGPGGPELAQVPLNIGSLLVPLLGLILAILWYYQIQYPYVFTATATACLGGVTLLVSIVAFSSYRR